MTTTLRARGIRFLKVLGPTVILLGALAGSAQAATLVIEFPTGVLTGARGVQVGSSFYDVTFVDGWCPGLFSGCDNANDDFAFQTEATASAAGLALLAQVFVPGPYDTNPTLTRGCPGTITQSNCQILIPFAVVSSFFTSSVTTNTSLEDDPVPFTSVQLDKSIVFTENNPNATFALFTPAAPVPEPATLTLCGIGCAGLGLARRRRRG